MRHDASMESPPRLAVWSRWRLHADVLVDALARGGEPARVVSDPLPPDLLLAGAAAPDLVRVLQRRRAAGRETVVWGGVLPAPRVAALRSAGASAYVSARCRPGELVGVVRRVRSGGTLPELPREAGPAVPRLTTREVEVARAYLVTGADRTRRQVASDLGISERTLKAHIANVRERVATSDAGTREGLRHTLRAHGLLP